MESTGGRGLRRELGLVQVTASGVGIIIGAGIYVLLGAATEEAGASVWAGFAEQWWLLALAAPVTGAAYAEAGRRWWAGWGGSWATCAAS